MKVIVSIAFLMCAATAFADLSSSESKRLSTAATVVRELRAMPDKGIPEDTWNRAECVAVIPGVKKAGLTLGKAISSLSNLSVLMRPRTRMSRAARSAGVTARRRDRRGDSRTGESPWSADRCVAAGRRR